MVGPQLEGLVNEVDGARLLKIDIVKWGSPVAAQYDIRLLPTVWLFEGRKRVEVERRAVMARLQASRG